MEKIIVTVKDSIGNRPEIDMELPGEQAFGLFKESLTRHLRGDDGSAGGNFYYRGQVLSEEKTLTESLVHEGAVLELF